MSGRLHKFAVEEYYHCYNRGTEKKVIFCDAQDYAYFLKSMFAYNTTEVRGKMRLLDLECSKEPYVEIVSFCLLPNHYHLVLRELTNKGISNFVKRLSGGYTMYFNKKYKRSGVLFQGKFKSKHIETDKSLQQVAAYVTFNYFVHNISEARLYRSSEQPQFRNLVRGRTSNSIKLSNETSMREIVDIIKESRLAFNE